MKFTKVAVTSDAGVAKELWLPEGAKVGDIAFVESESDKWADDQKSVALIHSKIWRVTSIVLGPVALDGVE